MNEQALKYLGYMTQTITPEMEAMMEECAKEVEKYAEFKAVYETFTLAHQPLSIPAIDLNLDYPALNHLLENCSQCILIACTLGAGLERRIRYYGKFDQARMIVMDAFSSVYVEAQCDAFEKNLNLNQRTYRFCPGYEQTPLSINRKIAKVLEIHKKIGVELSDSDLMIPQKSMIGIIGIGDSGHKKTCRDCMLKENCDFKRRNTRCYKTD